MAHAGFHVGTFLLLVAAACLLVATISAPTIHSISFLKITGGGADTTLGALGSCVGDACSGSHIGYAITRVAGNYHNGGIDNLTRALVLHPIITGIAFIAFFVALTSHCIGFLFASLIAAIACALTFVTMIIDFVIFGSVKSHINGNGGGRLASFGPAIWLTLAAFIILFVATFATCIACVTDRRHSRSTTTTSRRYTSRARY